MFQDLRFAIRTLIKNPAFTLAAVLCLTLGIGVNTTIFGCVRAILLRPYPYQDPDQLVAIGESNVPRGWRMNTVSYPNFRSWQADNRTLSNVGIYTGASFNLASSDAADTACCACDVANDALAFFSAETALSRSCADISPLSDKVLARAALTSASSSDARALTLSDSCRH
jgi:hypothetical protein